MNAMDVDDVVGVAMVVEDFGAVGGENAITNFLFMSFM